LGGAIKTAFPVSGKERAFPSATLGLLFVLAYSLWLIPVWSVSLPPLVDYPNHLARMHLLATPEIAQSGGFYEIHWAPLPNLAMDILVPAMSRFMPVEVAGKVFISLIFGLLAGGVFVLHWSLFQRWSAFPFLCFLFLYNRPLLWGFLNFLFGLGLSFWFFAGWIFFQRREPLQRIAFFLPCTLVLFFCHLFALGVYGLMILGFTLHRQRSGEVAHAGVEWTVALAPFIPAAALFFGASPTGSVEAVQEIRFGGLGRKLGALVQPVNNYHRGLDAATFLLLAGFFGAGLKMGWLRLAKPIRYPLLLLILFFLSMPEVLLTVMSVDTRIPNVAAFLLVAGVRFNGSRRWEVGVLAGLMALSLFRLGVVDVQWRQADRAYEVYREGISRIPPGSRLFSAVLFNGDWEPFPTPLAHLPCLAAGRSVFVPSLFAFPAQQPIRFSQEYKNLAGRYGGVPYLRGNQPPWDEVAKHFDYVWAVGKTGQISPPSNERFSVLMAGDDFRLWRVAP
jgi:hypothetical protein